MIRTRSWKWASVVFLLVIILQVSASSMAVAKTKEAFIAGKVYDQDNTRQRNQALRSLTL